MEMLKDMGVTFLVSRRVQPGDAVMFDIDDTLIRTTGAPIKPMINLLHIAKFLGYKIVVITAREPSSYTDEQLESLGIFPDSINFCRAEDKGVIKNYLKSVRGWSFILSVGDMPTDLTESEHWLNTRTYAYA